MIVEESKIVAKSPAVINDLHSLKDMEESLKKKREILKASDPGSHWI